MNATVRGSSATSDDVSSSCWARDHKGCSGTGIFSGAPGPCRCDCHRDGAEVRVGRRMPVNTTDGNAGQPVYLCWAPERGETEEDAVPVRALYESDAAEEWAEYDDRQGDYSIVSGAEVEVCVRREAGGPVKRFKVMGESVPSYSADELDAEGAADGG